MHMRWAICDIQAICMYYATPNTMYACALTFDLAALTELKKNQLLFLLLLL